MQRRTPDTADRAPVASRRRLRAARIAATTLAAAAIGGALALGAAPAGAATTSTLGSTLAQQSSAPVIGGDPSPAKLFQAYNYALTVSGSPAPHSPSRSHRGCERDGVTVTRRLPEPPWVPAF